MRRLATALTVLAALTAAPTVDAQARRQPGELRCGWLHNPTPGNYWLQDRDREWTIVTQGGGEGPPGWDQSPDFTTNGWVPTNGNYGYGCACLRVSVSWQEERVTRFYSGRPVPIAQCRRDRNLPSPTG